MICLMLFQKKYQTAGVLLTDDAFSSSIEDDKKQLLSLLESQHSLYFEIMVLTNSYLRFNSLNDLCAEHSNISIKYYDWVRPSAKILNSACDVLASRYKPPQEKKTGVEKDQPKKKKSLWGIFKNKEDSNSPEPTDLLTKEFERIGRVISRVIAITGHRGSGVSSTAFNIAHEASQRGISTMLVDLDIQYRSANMYFNKFNEMTQKDETIDASLIRTLAKPYDYKTTSFNINSNLWLTSLGYQFSDPKLLDQFFNTSKLIGMLSVFRNNFNLIILDMPMDLLGVFTESIINIDIFGLCVSNNLYSILNTIRNTEGVVDKENIALFKSKSALIVSKYNSESRFNRDIFTPDKVNEILTSGISTYFQGDMKIAGFVPYSSEFDKQIESDILIADTNMQFKENYDKILIRLMGG